jgi:hypothetical protein
MTKNEVHLWKRKNKQGETKDDVCDIGNDPIFCLIHKDNNAGEEQQEGETGDIAITSKGQDWRGLGGIW